MSKCPNCGKEIPENSRFCLTCGCEISPAENTGNPAPQNFAQPNYQQAPPQNFAGQPNYQQYPQYPQPQKKRWVLPVVIILIIVVILGALTAMAVIFKWWPFSGGNNNNSIQQEQLVDSSATSANSSASATNTPEAAVQTAMNDLKSQLKTQMPSIVMSTMPSELDAFKDQITPAISDMCNIIIDSIQYKIIDTKTNGNTATVKVEISMPDYENMGDISESQQMELGMALLSGNMSDAMKKIIGGLDTVTEDTEIEVKKDGNKWVADMPNDIEDMLENLQLF